MKKLLSGIVSLVMVGTMSITAFAADADNVTLKINGVVHTGTSFENCVTASGVSTNTITSLEIVSGTIDMLDWIYISEQSGGGTTPNMSESLQSLMISNDVVLESLLSSGKNEIGMGAFQYDKKLKTVNTGSAEGITDMAFLGCEVLTQVTAPNVTTIATDAFEDCTSLVTLNLPAIPPTAANFARTPSIKNLGFVSANGTPLTGTDLANALSAYKAVDDGDTTDDLWYGWKLSISPDIIVPDTTGDSTINMVGTTIPAPTYTVTIPEKLDFGTITKKVKTVSDAEAMANTSVQVVAVNHSNFFDNQKNITVAVTTDNQILKDETGLAFKLYEKGTENDTEITTGTNLFTIKPTAADTNVTAEKKIYAALDQRLIKASGDYTGTVTFTVAVADNK